MSSAEALAMLRAGGSPRELGVSEQTLRNWRRQDQIDRRERDDGLTSDERESCKDPPARTPGSSSNGSAQTTSRASCGSARRSTRGTARLDVLP
jgi:hypothetical protein